MNTAVKDLVERFFVKILHRNESNDDIDRTETLIYFNEATRELARWCSLYTPWFTRRTMDYSAKTGDVYIDPPGKIINVHGVFINGRQIPQASNALPPYKCYVSWDLIGFERITFVNYVAKALDKIVCHYTPAELPELIYEKTSDPDYNYDDTKIDRSYFPQMMDDLIIGHAVVSWEMRNGMLFDSEENARAKWFNQVTALLQDSKPVTIIGEYYESYQPRGADY